MKAHWKKGVSAPRLLPKGPTALSRSLEEDAVQKLAEHIEEGSIKTFNDVFNYIETAKKSQESSCPVCLKAWTSPARAKCGHIFCEHCIISWEASCRKRQLPVVCPCCRSSIEIVERTPPPPPAQSKKRKPSVPNPKQVPRKRCKHYFDGDWGWYVFYAFICCLVCLSLVLYWYGRRPGLNASRAAWQRWANSNTPGLERTQHVLPRLHELVEKYGQATYVYAKISITMFLKESMDLIPQGTSPDQYDLPVQAYYPVGTIFRIFGDVTPEKFNSAEVYHNCSVIDKYGIDTNYRTSVPMSLVTRIIHDRVYLVWYSDAKQKILHVEPGRFYSKQDLELNRATR